MCYQLPFDLLNIAIITHIYQWLEIKHTLIFLIDMDEYKQQEEVIENDQIDNNLSVKSKNISVRAESIVGPAAATDRLRQMSNINNIK